MLPWLGDSAFVVHVAKAGNDGNGGLAQQYPVDLAADAKLTIAGALAVCPDGGTILIWPGDYAEAVDLVTAEKSISLVGTHRQKSRIIPGAEGGTYGIDLYDYCNVINLSVYCEDATARAVKGDLSDNKDFQIINCDIRSDGVDGLYLVTGIVKNCFIFCQYDVLYLSAGDTTIDGCTLIGDAGLNNGCRGISGGTKVILRNSTILLAPWYDKTGKGAPQYTITEPLKCISGPDRLVMENCILMADGYKVASTHEDSSFDADAICIQLVNDLTVNNCVLYARTDQNKSKTAYGIQLYERAVIKNTNIYAGGQLASYEMYGSTPKVVWLNNVFYDQAKIHSNVTIEGNPADIIEINHDAGSAANLKSHFGL